MTVFNLTTEIVRTSQVYVVRMDEETPVSLLARYLSQQETYINASTVEIARQLNPEQRLQDTDYQSGQRLVLYTRPSEEAELTAPLKPGDKILGLYNDQSSYNSRGSKQLRLGRSDKDSNSIPDVDLRGFIAPKYHSRISRDCMELTFNDDKKIWQAKRTGNTRIKINEDEISKGESRLFDNHCIVRFFAGGTDQDHLEPLGEIKISMETVQSQRDVIYLPAGQNSVKLHVGAETQSLKLRISDNMKIDQVIEQLASFLSIEQPEQISLFLLKLVPPNASVQALSLDRDQFLYLPRRLRYARNLLQLKDVHQRKIFELYAGAGDEEKIIGRRDEAEQPSEYLDVDLFEVVKTNANEPESFKHISRRHAYVFYRPADNTWWIRLNERAKTSVFINTTRLTGSTPIQLTTGDVLSFGPDINRYLARLEVEIKSQVPQE